MASGSFQLHEEGLPADVVERHRAIVSIMEELEAVDWYDQRVAVSTDPELAAVLAHNRDEEKEHFAMTLEWLRRHDPKIDEVLHTYLFTTGDILEEEREAEHGDDASASGAGGLSIGSLRGDAGGEL
jgi:ferritin-like protein